MTLVTKTAKPNTYLTHVVLNSKLLTAHDLNAAPKVLKVHCHYRHDQPPKSWYTERSLEYTSTSPSTTEQSI
jgi:hypothetical protein